MKNDMQFTGKNGEFQIRHMVEKTQLNFPVANEEGIKSSVTQTFGGDRCTFTEKGDFFSYRRDRITGRMASFIWLI